MIFYLYLSSENFGMHSYMHYSMYSYTTSKTSAERDKLYRLRLTDMNKSSWKTSQVIWQSRQWVKGGIQPQVSRPGVVWCCWMLNIWIDTRQECGHYAWSWIWLI